MIADCPRTGCTWKSGRILKSQSHRVIDRHVRGAHHDLWQERQASIKARKVKSK